jgi:hypothetical protein
MSKTPEADEFLHVKGVENEIQQTGRRYWIRPWKKQNLWSS